MNIQVGDMFRFKANGYVCIITNEMQSARGNKAYSVHWLTKPEYKNDVDDIVDLMQPIMLNEYAASWLKNSFEKLS